MQALSLGVFKARLDKAPEKMLSIKKSRDRGSQHGNRLTPSHDQPALCPSPCPSPCPAVLAPLILQRPVALQSSPVEMVSAGHWSLCVTAGTTALMAPMS